MSGATLTSQHTAGASASTTTLGHTMRSQLSCSLFDDLLGNSNASPDSGFMDACHEHMDTCLKCMDFLDTAADIIDAFHTIVPMNDMLEDQDWDDLVSCIGSANSTANETDTTHAGVHQNHVSTGQDYVFAPKQHGAQWQEPGWQQQQQILHIYHQQQPQQQVLSEDSVHSCSSRAHGGTPAAAAAAALAGLPYLSQGSSKSSSGGHSCVQGASQPFLPPISGLAAADKGCWETALELCYQAAEDWSTADAAAGIARAIHDTMGDPAAAAAAAGMSPSSAGLFAYVESPAQLAAVTARAQHLLGDLATHLNTQQQQQQQVVAVCPASAVAAWLQAAWYLEVVACGAVAAAASPAATTQAIAAAKVAGADTGTPDWPLLQLVEQLLLLLLLLQAGGADMSAAASGVGCIGGVAGGGNICGGSAGGVMSMVAGFACVLEVVRELQQGLGVVQGLAAAAEPRSALSCKGLLQTYLVTRSMADVGYAGLSGMKWSAQMTMQLAALM